MFHSIREIEQKRDNYFQQNNGSFTQEENTLFSFENNSYTQENNYNTYINNYNNALENLYNKKESNSFIDKFQEILGSIVDKTDGETKDGEIGYTTQGTTGDCWLLSGVNALNSTEEGREILKNSLEYKDGYTIVHLKGAGDYIVTDKEVNKTKSTAAYSDGDDDMIIFELAIEQVIDDVANGKLELSRNASWMVEGIMEEHASTDERSSTEGGFIGGALYLLTGKSAEYHTDKNEMNNILTQYEQNDNKNFAIGASKKDTSIVKDINGNSIELPGGHAYSIKNVDGNKVTVINPWDTSKEIILDRDVFLKEFYSITSCDLSAKNQEQNMLDEAGTNKEINDKFIYNMIKHRKGAHPMHKDKNDFEIAKRERKNKFFEWYQKYMAK